MNDIQNLNIYIARRPNEIYEFASDPRNLPRWAAGLARSQVKRDGDEWVVESPFGKVRVKFADRNAFGVMDHDVKLESGVIVHNHMIPAIDCSRRRLMSRCPAVDAQLAQIWPNN